MFLGGGRTQAGGSSSSAGPNKVRQFRSGDPMEERDAQKTWESLKKAIHQIHAHNASTLSFEELYRNAYNLVLHKHGALLYNGVQQVVLDHLKEIATDVIRAADEGLLDELKVQWDDHRTVMVMIRDILMYLDRNYVSQYKKIPVYEMGLIAFREQVTAHERVKDRLLKILLDKVNQERNGEQIDRILLKHTLTMLVELGAGGQNVYKTCFEDWFIEDARTFYQHESTKYVSEHTVGEYCKKAEARIREEKQRVQSYLHESTMDKIQSLMDKEWIQRHYETLVSTGARPMFEGDKVEDLERMFRLFVRVPESLKPLHSVLRECIKDAAKAILSDAEKHKEPVSFIDALLKLREKYSTIVRDAFQNSKEFQISLKTSFEETLNGDTSTARYLSLFVDELFRKGMRSVSGQLLDQADTRLDQVVTIFRYLQDKDIFESYYKHHFAKRLLSGKQADDGRMRPSIHCQA
ncbi:unnamed protein product [Amoebophrya sp. A25]|nr:unnamed protein product [Amoebophrya sp. A25]|eukprot:GSA25T00017066001.1